MMFGILYSLYLSVYDNIVPRHTYDEYSVLISKSGITVFGIHCSQSSLAKFRAFGNLNCTQRSIKYHIGATHIFAHLMEIDLNTSDGDLSSQNDDHIKI
jgi:hypothetical protein